MAGQNPRYGPSLRYSVDDMQHLIVPLLVTADPRRNELTPELAAYVRAELGGDAGLRVPLPEAREPPLDLPDRLGDFGGRGLPVRLGDAALGRQGRMIAAVASIGLGVVCEHALAHLLRPLFGWRLL